MTMDGELKREVAFAGQRVKQKVVFALAWVSARCCRESFPTVATFTALTHAEQHVSESGGTVGPHDRHLKLAAFREPRPLRHRSRSDRHAMGSGSTPP